MAFLNKAQYLCEYFCESPIVIKRALKLFIDTAQESAFMVTVRLLYVRPVQVEFVNWRELFGCPETDEFILFVELLQEDDD